MVSSTFDTIDERTMVGNNISRIPSPTPSEAELLNTRSAKILIGFHKPGGKRPWLFYASIIITLIVVILSTVFEDNIADWVRPGAEKVKNLPAGFLIPVVVLIIISFPPFYGQEIVTLLVGLVWGLWPGFAIVCTGMAIGEVLSFCALKYWVRKYEESLEKQSVQYAALARIIRGGGLVVAVVARYSVIPDNSLRTLFSVCGVRFWVFLISYIFSLPLYLLAVFYGQTFIDDANGKNQALDNIVGISAFAATIIVMCAAVFYLGSAVDKIKEDLVLQRRIDRQPKLTTGDFSHDDKSSSPIGEESKIECSEYRVRFAPISGPGVPVSPIYVHPTSCAPGNDTSNS